MSIVQVYRPCNIIITYCTSAHEALLLKNPHALQLAIQSKVRENHQLSLMLSGTYNKRQFKLTNGITE